MRINTSTQQIQKQLLSPVMQQSIEILLLPLTELAGSIEQEIQNNPLLEVDEEKWKAAREQPREELLKTLAQVGSLRHSAPLRETAGDDETFEDRPIKVEPHLEDELLQQLRMELSDPLEIRIGEMIIGNLDEDGYLTTTCEDIASAVGISDIPRVEYILKIIQNFEPAGIASRSLRECLLFQVKFRCNGKSRLVSRIIDECLADLGAKKFQKIARRLGVPLNAVKEAARLIAGFEPKPARNHRPVPANIYVKPDVIVKQDENDQLQVQINQDEIPPLRINTKYQNMLRQRHLTEEERHFIREKLKNALTFIKSVAQRSRTLHKITEYIIERQKGFFTEGHTALVPMALKDIAVAVERNESTVSRAISRKYIDTPHGLFPLKFFLSQAIGDDPVTSRSIKEEIRELITDENTSSPLSDADIEAHFRQKGTCIARRTVSKYRQALRILPSHLRKK